MTADLGPYIDDTFPPRKKVEVCLVAFSEIWVLPVDKGKYTKLIRKKYAAVLSIKVVPTVLILVLNQVCYLLKRHTYYMKFTFLQFMLVCLLAYYYTCFFKNCVYILIYIFL